MSIHTQCTFVLPRDKSMKRIRKTLTWYGNPPVITLLDGPKRLYLITVPELSLSESAPVLDMLVSTFSLRFLVREGWY